MKNGFHNYLRNIGCSIILLVLCPSFHIVRAQTDVPKFNMKVKLSIKSGNLDHAVINITKNGSPYRVIDPNKGRYTIDLDFGAEYMITCTKMGYITKSLVVDTHIPNGREKEDFSLYTAEVELAPQPEYQEITYNQPVGRIKYSMESGDFDADRDYTATAQEMQRKAEANPIPKPKSPDPNPRPTPPPLAATNTPPSKPIPPPVKQPEYKPAPPKPKPKSPDPNLPPKPFVRRKVEHVVQEDRRKLTIVEMTINDSYKYTYKKEEYSWGGMFYYFEDKVVTQRTFEKETDDVTE